jgi:PKD repeat protein
MKQLLSLLRRHGRVVAGAAVILLASGIAFALRSAGPAHAQPAAAASSAASASVASAASAAGPTAAATNQGPARPVALVRSRSRSGSSLSRRGPALAPTEAPNRPGPAAQPASSRSVALSLRQATGLSISQVSARDVCPPVGAGQARCAAKALVLRSTGAPVHPPAGAGAALGRVRTTAAPATVPPAAATPPVADTPAYLQQAYDLSYLSQNAGHGDTVAVVDAYDDPSAESDLATYRSTYGLPACTTANGCFRKVNQSGAASPLPTADSGWDQEITLDLDAVSAICPNCHILLVEANSSYFSDLAPAMQTAASLGANQISASWSGTSSSPLSGTYTFTGIPTVAATGDDGYVGPGYDSYPAALPNVTAAGGTSLATASGSGVRGFSESAWSGAGSGCDTQFATPPYQPSTSCGHRAYADVSADADPATGLRIYENNSWYLVGGTSLSTPLIASYYAITGVTTSTSQWAYSDSSLLNDIVSGTNGSCAAGISSICNAGVGFDGPTGVGSISGAVATGAPGIGASNAQSVGAQNATIAGGIYRNGLDTTWSIQYGPTNSYGSQTTPVDIGAGSAAMAVTQSLSGLAASTTYHYRLVATNALGTNYGYDYTFTTAASSAPSAAFAVTPTAPTPSSPVTFDATASTPGAGNTMTAYSWNFGDGASASTQTASHSYAAAGTYTVTLTVTNSAARSSTTTQTITVDNPPTASFTPSGTFAAPGASLSFNAGASTAGTGSTINDYSWNFGDGSVQDTGATASAAHT